MTGKSIKEIIEDHKKIMSSLNINKTLNNLSSSFILPSSFNNGRQKSLKKVITEINEYEKAGNNYSDEICHTCNKKINSHLFYSLRKYEEVQLDDDLEYRVEDQLEDKLIECNDFCSGSCLEAFSDKHEETIEEYELYEVRRCSCYYDCLDLENIRGICEREERLDYESNLFPSLPLHNFCEPADAGIIKASINIKKQLDEGSKQNSDHFKITAVMTILVILLTIANIFLVIDTNYEHQLDSIDAKLGAINNSLSSLNNQANDINSELDPSTLLVSSNLENSLDNTNKTVEFSNKS
ncbi:hypothetical protein [Methanolobus bombayensis]|uniref:hypothetical protein n=1 Tax=Methanolobus bombayensis TaxID=38023 RepID=UPI001AE45517|nr:hypothetical protein [Methanolobus bombayensis]MBP1908254.1 hypothetical protein [Methanolobus bombayensis]